MKQRLLRNPSGFPGGFSHSPVFSAAALIALHWAGLSDPVLALPLTLQVQLQPVRGKPRAQRPNTEPWLMQPKRTGRGHKR